MGSELRLGGGDFFNSFKLKFTKDYPSPPGEERRKTRRVSSVSNFKAKRCRVKKERCMIKSEELSVVCFWKLICRDSLVFWESTVGPSEVCALP